MNVAKKNVVSVLICATSLLFVSLISLALCQQATGQAAPILP